MSSPSFKHAFELFKAPPNVKSFLEKTIIKIIDLKAPDKSPWPRSAFWNAVKAEGMHISLLSKPCQLSSVDGHDGPCGVVEAEAKFAFTGRFWLKVEQEPVAASICISHMRALNEALNELPGAQMVIILEGDVDTNENTMQLFSALMANWYCNPDLEHTHCVFLTYSDWHPTFAKKMHQHPLVLHSSKVPPYFALQALPTQGQTSKQEAGFHFVGQGARAVAYSSELSKHIIETKFDNFYDLHLMRALSTMAHHAKMTNKPCQAVALVATPPIFTHIPKFENRFRGSGRLESLATTPAEETSYYFTLDVSHEWGLANRTQTVILWMIFASWHRLGIYICWAPTKACKCTFDDCWVLNISKPPLHTIPFVRMVSSRHDHMWMASGTNKHWCIGHIESQCQVPMGRDYFQKTYMDIAQTHTRGNQIRAVMTAVQQAETQDLTYWNSLSLKDSILKEAKDWLDHWSPRQTHVAVHVRRGDHKVMNYLDKIKHRDMTTEEKSHLEAVWAEADEQVEDWTGGHVSNTCLCF